MTITSVTIQVLRELTRKDALIDLLLENTEGIMGKVMIGSSLCHSDHEVVKFKIFSDRKKTASKTLTLDMERTNLKFHRKLVRQVIWETAFERVEIHHCWSLSSDTLKAPEQTILKCQKSNRWDTRLAWPNKDLLLEVRWKKKVYGHSK